jgi:hypothetical protein
MEVVLRLRIENKDTMNSYKSSWVTEITNSVVNAVHKLKIKNPQFESLIKLKDNRVTYCIFKMSPSVWKFFLAAYGSFENVALDYEVILI